MVLRRKLTQTELDTIMGYLMNKKLFMDKEKEVFHCYAMTCDECIFGTMHKCVTGGTPEETRGIMNQVKENNPEYFL